MEKTILRTRIAHFKDETDLSNQAALEYLDDAIVVFENGKVTLLDDANKLSQQGFDLTNADHQPDSLLMSGFIDSHVHVPQLDIIGSYGKQLLDWLNDYTFPMETLFSDEEHSKAMTKRFIDCLFAQGTTTAMAFTTSFAHSAEHLFEEAYKRNMRLLAGKVTMDCNAPDALLDTPELAFSDSSRLIEKWHGEGRLGYAITPRFAITSSVKQLEYLKRLQNNYPGVWLQTHLSENKQEVDFVKELFPSSKDYLDVYETYGLHTDKTVFAHGIHLSDMELDRLKDTGSTIAFCPSSNLFLGSGLLDLERVLKAGVNVVLASDVGAGTSLSMFKTMGDAYKVCQLQGNALSACDAYYMSSLGAAKALKLSQHIGNLDVGKEADAILINPKTDPYFKDRTNFCKTIEEELFVYMITGDDRLIDRTYVAGQVQYSKKN